MTRGVEVIDVDELFGTDDVFITGPTSAVKALAGRDKQKLKKRPRVLIEIVEDEDVVDTQPLSGSSGTGGMANANVETNDRPISAGKKNVARRAPQNHKNPTPVAGHSRIRIEVCVSNLSNYARS